MSNETNFRKVFDGVADQAKTYELFNMHNGAPWNEARISGAIFAGEWFEIDESTYWYFLNVLPPRYIPNGFAVIEAIAGNVYRCFYSFNCGGQERFFCAACDVSNDSLTHHLAASSMLASFIHGETVAA